MPTVSPSPPALPDFVAFEGASCLAEGPLEQVVRKAQEAMAARADAKILIFHGQDSRVLEIDYRGTPEQIAQRIARQHDAGGVDTPSTADEPPASTGPGRPRLGVVAREVTLLPRHWEWLNSQPGGASVALRKLVEAARKTAEPADRVRQAQEASYRFMSIIAGDLPGFEEAARALFAADATRFAALLAAWPPDIGQHLQRLAGPVFTLATPGAPA